MMEFKATLNQYADKTEQALDRLFPEVSCPQEDVIRAMRYSLLGGGKRLRSSLVLAFCAACGGDEEKALPFACAVEMIHAYSLIHDDLPCMDDDDLRRGKPSCHVAFGEATALLAGDGLLTQGFALMLEQRHLPAETVLRAASCLGKAAGVFGMIGGQVMDLANEKNDGVDIQRLKDTDALKTGALIQASCEMGCLIAGATEDQIAAARDYGQKIGLAFQITDDILDVTSTTEELGKPVGSDVQQNKATYAALYGVEKAREVSADLLNQAKESLKHEKLDTPFLCGMADYILARKN